MTEQELEQKAKALKNAYQREWRKAHPERKVWKPTPEKRREYNRRYWLKKAAAECIADLVEEQQIQK